MLTPSTASLLINLSRCTYSWSKTTTRYIRRLLVCSSTTWRKNLSLSAPACFSFRSSCSPYFWPLRLHVQAIYPQTISSAPCPFPLAAVSPRLRIAYPRLRAHTEKAVCGRHLYHWEYPLETNMLLERALRIVDRIRKIFRITFNDILCAFFIAITAYLRILLPLCQIRVRAFYSLWTALHTFLKISCQQFHQSLGTGQHEMSVTYHFHPSLLQSSGSLGILWRVHRLSVRWTLVFQMYGAWGMKTSRKVSLINRN